MILHNPFGPIFEMELRATSRRKRTYALRAAYLGGLLLFLLLAYVGNMAESGRGVAQRVMQQNQLGREFFIAFSLFCVGAMAVIGPVLTCTAISAERLHKTLHVLLMTPISAWQIVTGKLFSRLLVALTLIGLSLPVLALVRLLGGVEVEQMFGVISLATATAIVTAAMGLFMSTFMSRAYAAILFSYGLFLVMWFFAPMFVMVWGGTNGPPPMWTLQFAVTTSPLFATAFLVLPGAPLLNAPWIWAVAVQLGLASVLVTWSALVLRRLQRREGAGRAVDHAPAALPPATEQANQLNGTDPAAARAPTKKQHRWRRRRRDVGDNPVLWRELGRPLFAKRWQAFVAAALVIALLVVSYVSFGSADLLDYEELQCAYAAGFNGVAWLVLAVLAATAIAQEKESDTWTLLLATPIRGRDIVLGKILGLYRRMLWPGLLVAAHFAVFALCGVISWLAVALVLWIIFSFNTVWVASGLYLSLRLRKVTFAVILNLAIAVVLYVGVPVAMGIVTGLTPGPHEWAEKLLWGLPYFHLVMVVDRLTPGYDLGSTFWGPGEKEMQLSGLVQGAVIAGVVHLLLAGAIVLIMLARFNRIVARAEQQAPLDSAPPPVSAGSVIG